jgi:signal transduction histidine kinase
MLNGYIVVSSLLAIIFILLGFVVATRNIQSKLNRLFLLFSVSMAGWLVTNYIGGDPSYSHSVSLVANKLIFLFGIMAITSLLFFMKTLVGRNASNLWNGVLALNILFAFLSLTPLIVQDVALQDATYAITFGVASAGFLLLFMVDLFLLVYVALSGRRHSTAQLRSQINTILASLILFMGTVFITNGLVPFIAGYYGLANAGALLSTVLVFGVAYSMVKHRLFDIRSFVARSAAYVLLLATLAGLFAAAILALTSLFFENQNTSTSFQVTYLIIALLLALLLQPLKRFFDKTTNQLFYRDAYNSQELLNELNRSLVTTIDLEELLAKSSKIIGETLKSGYCHFAIREPETDQLRVIGVRLNSPGDDKLRDFISSASRTNEKILVFDELDSSKTHLAESMSALNVAVYVRLQGTSKAKNQNPGFILMGHKKSGGLYSAQDIQILEIIADELVIAIQNSLRFEEIQQFNITLRKKVEEATGELRRVNARLRELDKTKDEFISMASHQLRTPLTAVKGYLSMILEGDTGPVKKSQKEMIQRSFDGAQKMVYLISDMLNVSRLQTGKFVIENKPTNLPDVVQGEVDQLKEEVAQKKITLNFKKPSSYPTLNLDETKIRQVIMNFLDNALYYTPSGGQIEVKLEASPESTSYTVSDTGVGVPKDVQHHLFSKFYRADNARKMRPDGTGLGLYMAKKVITAQGGAIIFKSEEGKGSTFGFSFPRKTTETTAVKKQ